MCGGAEDRLKGTRLDKVPVIHTDVSLQAQTHPGLLGRRIRQILPFVHSVKRAGLQHQVSGLIVALLFVLLLFF